jgi:hypothetical protein
MHLHTRNINTAFRELVQFFRDGRDDRRETFFQQRNPVVRKPSRVGEVLRIEEPVTITYSHPRERVLFNAARDANPFFHLYESLWMLAGRRDIAPLAYYSSGYAKQVQDGDRSFANGAYGYRWRHAHTTLGDDQVGPDNFEYDQLQLLIAHLKADPNSRRAVLQMWNVEDDLLKIGQRPDPMTLPRHDCPGLSACRICRGGESKDVCCNTAVYFSLRFDLDKGPACTCGADRTGPSAEAHGKGCLAGKPRTQTPKTYLDMTVTNRSNDLIWGTLGSDYVNLGFLQEYMAAHLGVEVGVYNQFSNNLHVYTERFKPEEWLAWYNDPRIAGKTYEEAGWYGSTVGGRVFPLVKDPTTFDKELPLVIETYKDREVKEYLDLQEPFLRDVAQPMLLAFFWHKYKGKPEIEHWLKQIKADDWRIAATQWIERRLLRRKDDAGTAQV